MKKNEMRRLTLPDFNFNYIATEIKIMKLNDGQKHRSMKQNNKPTHGQPIDFDKV